MADHTATNNSNVPKEGHQTAASSSSNTDMVSVRFETGTLTTDPSAERLPEQVNGEPLSTVVNRPKKSLFEITSVVNTENESGRGESHGNDFDSELDDTFGEVSKPTTPDELGSSADSQSQGNATSRFRIVKILRTEPYKKGRWQCQDMLDSENKANDKSGLPHSSSKHGESQAIEPSNSLHSSAGSEQSIRAYNQQHDDSSNVTSNGAKKPSSIHSYQQSNTKLDNQLGLQNDVDANMPSRRFSNESSQNIFDQQIPVLQPMVNSIETALNQISSIKSTLLSTFNDQVPNLKQTIANLTDENTMLREENQRLRQALQMERRAQSGEKQNDISQRDKS